MRLTEYTAELSVAKQKLLQRRLNFLTGQTGLSYQVVSNFNVECHLEKAVWQEIVEALSQARIYSKSLKTAITQASRKHILQGSVIACPRPTCLGRAVTKEDFYDFLLKQGYVFSRDQAEQFVSRLVHPASHTAPRSLRSKWLGRFLMWATFDPEDSSRDPFARMPSDADAIRARLGLDRSGEGRDMLLFLYALPDEIELLFPTIADACAGDVWLWYFRPAPANALHGWTMPWNEKLVPCPEVVHEPIKGDALVAPVRVAMGK